jgi:carbon storage regulator
MLVLSRKLSQQVLIGSDISITVVKIDRNHVRLGIKAPADVTIVREELLVARHEPKLRPAASVGRLHVRRSDRTEPVCSIHRER